MNERQYLAGLESANADQVSELLRRPSVEEERVLYLHLEIQRAFFVRRLCKICEARQLKTELDNGQYVR